MVALAALAVLLGVGVLLAATRGDSTGRDGDPAAAAGSTGSTGSAVSTGPTGPTDQPPAGAALFGPAPAAAASVAPDTSLGTPRRARYVTFLSAALPATAAGQTLVLHFFDDAEFVGTVERMDRQPLLTSWSGPLDDSPHSDFVVTRAGGRYQVTASTAQGVFTMSMTRAGLYQIVEVGQPVPIDSGGAAQG